VRSAGEVVAKLVGQENAEQGGGEGPSEEEVGGVADEPRPRPQIAVGGDCWESQEEVLHEPRTDGHCREDAQDK